MTGGLHSDFLPPTVVQQKNRDRGQHIMLLRSRAVLDKLVGNLSRRTQSSRLPLAVPVPPYFPALLFYRFLAFYMARSARSLCHILNTDRSQIRPAAQTVVLSRNKNDLV